MPPADWFWTSGSDGVLRVQGCDECQRLVHPPVAICPWCRSTASHHQEVSGEAVVVGFTINQHPWLPGEDPVYVIAVVSLREDDTVRLTTNIVDGDPADVRVGSTVRVQMRERDDVWIPEFVLDDSLAPITGPPPTRRPVPRPPVSDERFEHRSVISGIGRSAIGRRLMVDPLSLTVDACLTAIADAGLAPEDIDGLSTYPGPVGMGMSEGGVTAVEEALRLQPTWINAGMEIPGQGGAVIAAMLAVSAGLCDHVLCFRTVWESTFAAMRLHPPGGGRASGWQQWRAPFGAISAANWIGMHANRYFATYGADRSMLARIALNGRAHAQLNPHAIYRDPMTMDDYLSARPITSPFGLYDCDVPCDGAVAIIVSRADVARDLPQPAVRVEAVGTQISERISWDQGVVTHEPQTLSQAAHLWTRTSLTPADVDLALLYDGFTFNAISWLEGLGFCGLGEAQDWIGDGSRIALGGELPLNPHGGQLSEGRLHGFGFLYEAVTQLRHAAAARQVAGARTAVVTTGGGTPSSAFLLQRHDA